MPSKLKTLLRSRFRLPRVHPKVKELRAEIVVKALARLLVQFINSALASFMCRRCRSQSQLVEALAASSITSPSRVAVMVGGTIHHHGHAKGNPIRLVGCVWRIADCCGKSVIRHTQVECKQPEPTRPLAAKYAQLMTEGQVL